MCVCVCVCAHVCMYWYGCPLNVWLDLNFNANMQNMNTVYLAKTAHEFSEKCHSWQNQSLHVCSHPLEFCDVLKAQLLMTC